MTAANLWFACVIYMDTITVTYRDYTLVGVTDNES